MKERSLPWQKRRIHQFVWISLQEKMKYEIADELGLLDRVMKDGWKSLSSKETGRIGGILARKRKNRSKK